MNPPRTLLLDQLHAVQWSTLVPTLREVIRLLRSPAWERLRDADVRQIGNYRAVELGDETFFEASFTAGKEAAATLGLAQVLGREVVLDDLLRLHASLGCETREAA